MGRLQRRAAWLFGGVLSLAACTGMWPLLESRLPPAAVVEGISATELQRHVAALASDEFEGRAPGTRGEDLTLDYLVRELKRAGARPGNIADASYLQAVPLIGIASVPSASFCVRGQCTAWKLNEDFVGGSFFLQPEVHVDGSEVVFVGHGLVEEGRDDYKDVDVHGKTVLMLAEDPGAADVPGEGRAGSSRSGGSYASRAVALARKREEAVAKGAAARILVHEKSDPVGPLSVYAWSAEELDIESRTVRHLPVSLRADETKVRELVALAGHDYEALKRLAGSKDFRPIPLGVTASLEVKNALRRFTSHNVVARIEGSDAKLRDQYVVHVAHWDHLGRDASKPGSPVYHGALDNASGLAGLIEIARAYARLPVKPRRSVLILATTGEENGLLGAKHYATHPLVPLSHTAGVLNLDALNPWGPTRDFEIVGTASAAMHLALIDAAAALGKDLSADTRPDMGFFYRSDQLEFSRLNVPAVWIRRGSSYIGKPASFGREMNAAYFANDYHRPSDTPRPDWDYSGMAEQVRFTFLVGHRLAMGD